MQQDIERQPRSMRLARRRHDEPPVLHRQSRARRDDVKVFGGEKLAIARLHHVEGGVCRQEIDQKAFMGRVEVLHQDEGKAGLPWQGSEQLPTGVQTAGRGADSDDGLRPGRVRMCCRRDGSLLFPAQCCAAAPYPTTFAGRVGRRRSNAVASVVSDPARQSDNCAKLD